MEFEEAFQHAGNFGKFQILVICTFFLTNMVFGSQMLLMVIVGAKPDVTIPSEVNLTTIVTEWNLYDRMWIIDLMASLFMAGYIAGTVMFGQLPDLLGRKPMIIITYIGVMACSFSSAFCKNWKTFAVTRFTAGMCTGIVSPTVYVIMCELVGKAHWGRITPTYSMFFPLGTVSLALLGYTIQDWRQICIVVSTVPLILLPLYMFVIPESPRWLYSVGKIDKAEKVLWKIAQRNGKNKASIKLVRDSSEKSKDLRKYTILDLCRVPKLRIRLLACCCVWFSCSLVYYGLALNASDFMPNLYLAVVLLGLIELPAFLLSLLIVDKKWFGRQGSSLVLLLTCGASMTGLIFIDAKIDSVSTSKTVLGLLGKLAIAGVFSLLYLHTSELFPTQLRVFSVVASSVCARAGAIVAPFVPLLSSVAPYLPYIVFASVAVLAAAVMLFLPETLGKGIPEMPHLEKRGGNAKERTKKYGTFVDDENNKLLVNEVNKNPPRC